MDIRAFARSWSNLLWPCIFSSGASSCSTAIKLFLASLYMREEEYKKFLGYRSRNIVITVIVSILIVAVAIFVITTLGDTISVILGVGLIIATAVAVAYAIAIRDTNLYTNGELKHLIMACETGDELDAVDSRCRNFVGSCFFQFDERRKLYRECREKVHALFL